MHGGSDGFLLIYGNAGDTGYRKYSQANNEVLCRTSKGKKMKYKKYKKTGTTNPSKAKAGETAASETSPKCRLFGRSYWRDVVIVSVLAALGVISGMINYISDSDRPLFANVFWSLLYLAAWCVCGAFSASRRPHGHPVRVMYAAWSALSAAAALAMLLLSCLPGSDAFLQSGAGGAVGGFMFALCMPLYGICFFGSAGYIANDILLFAVSVAVGILPRLVEKMRAERF